MGNASFLLLRHTFVESFATLMFKDGEFCGLELNVEEDV